MERVESAIAFLHVIGLDLIVRRIESAKAPSTPGRTKLFQRIEQMCIARASSKSLAFVRLMEWRPHVWIPSVQSVDGIFVRPIRHTPNATSLKWDNFPLCCEHRQTVSMKSLDRNSIISTLWFPLSATAANAALRTYTLSIHERLHSNGNNNHDSVCM